MHLQANVYNPVCIATEHLVANWLRWCFEILPAEQTPGGLLRHTRSARKDYVDRRGLWRPRCRCSEVARAAGGLRGRGPADALRLNRSVVASSQRYVLGDSGGGGVRGLSN